MKKIFILAMIFLISAHLCFAESTIPKENRAIMKPPCSDWIPSEDNIEKALSSICDYLKNINNSNASKYDKESTKELLNNYSDYYVQFEGKISGGKKSIYCNFFFSAVKHNHPNWKEFPVMVLGGGYWYWSIEYDIETGKCFNFRVNSPM